MVLISTQHEIYSYYSYFNFAFVVGVGEISCFLAQYFFDVEVFAVWFRHRDVRKFRGSERICSAPNVLIFELALNLVPRVLSYWGRVGEDPGNEVD